MLIVKHREKIRTINETKISLLFKIIEKKARSSLNFKPFNLEILPVKPKLKTITKIITKEISKLLTKILSLNGETDTLYIDQPNFASELDVFIKSDINRPSLSDKYSVDSIVNSGKLYKIIYTAKDEMAKTRKLSIQFDSQNKVGLIDIRLFNGSPITKNVQHLIYRPKAGYVIKDEQYFMGNKDEIMVEGSFKQKRR
mgnify:CR=1 FL=1